MENVPENLSPSTEPYEKVYRDYYDISYAYLVSWVSGCVTETKEQNFRSPLGSDSDVTAEGLFLGDFNDCKFPPPPLENTKKN